MHLVTATANSRQLRLDHNGLVSTQGSKPSNNLRKGKACPPPTPSQPHCIAQLLILRGSVNDAGIFLRCDSVTF